MRDDAIMATGRSDYPNQVNNVLGFPYIFRGALDVRATTINMEMKIAAARALADLAREDVPDEVAAAYGARPKFGPDYIIPVPFDPRLISAIPPAVAKAAMDTGVARKPIVDMDAYRAAAARAARSGRRRAAARLRAAAPARRKRVVFAEGEEEQVIRAAASFVAPGARHRAAGRPRGARARERADARRRARRRHRDHQCRGCRSATPPMPTISTSGCSARAILLRDCQRLINQDRNHFAACMVALGDADAMVTGVTRNFSVALEDVRRVHRSEARPPRDRRLDRAGARPHRARRRHRGHRDAGRRGPRRHRRGGGRRRAPARLRAAPRAARLSRPSAIRRASARRTCRRRCASSTSAASISNTTARWRPTSRSTGAARGLSVLPAVGPGQRAGHAGVPLGLDLDQAAAGARRRDRDRPDPGRARPAGADRAARRPRTPSSSTWRRSRRSM